GGAGAVPGTAAAGRAVPDPARSGAGARRGARRDRCRAAALRPARGVRARRRGRARRRRERPGPRPPPLEAGLAAARRRSRLVAEGRVRAIAGIAIHVAGLRAAIGDACTIRRSGGGPLLAEVVGFEGGDAVVLALGDQHGVAPWDPVENDHRALQVATGPAL